MQALLLGSALLLACGACASPEADDSSREAPATRATAPSPALVAPSLPADEYARLRDSVTYIDYLFFELSFSMSMSEPPAIRYALEGISPEAAVPRAACPAMGRIFYKVGGRTVREADLHFAPGCTYLAFYGDDGRVAYANELSPAGEAFFNNQFRQLLPNYTDIE